VSITDTCKTETFTLLAFVFDTLILSSFCLPFLWIKVYIAYVIALREAM